MRTGDALGGLYDALEGMDATEERSSRAVATVVGRDADGTVWVHVPGGVRATPARMCTVDASPGDSVMVAFERNGVTVEGNASDPSAGTKGLARAEARADRAVEVAKAVRAELVEADRVIAGELEASRAEVRELAANSAKVGDLAAATGRIGTLEAATADLAEVRANSAKVANLTAAQLEADHAKVAALDADQMAADHAAIGALDATYARVTLENVENSWIDKGVIRDAAISDAQIAGVSANKITAGTIDASKVNVTNLKAKNISVEKINGVPVTGKSVADALAAAEGEIDGVASDVSALDSKLDAAVGDLNARVDAQIETWTAKAVPTLSNHPASDWNTDKLRAEHVGDVCYVVNAASEADGYTYRFARDESSGTFGWVLIKDNQVTKALQDLIDAQGDISGLKSFQTETSHWMEETDEGVESLRARTTAVEAGLGTKVDSSTFNEVKNTVDGNSATITQLATRTDTAMARGVEYIVGTHGTTAVSAWTGETQDGALYAGKQIAYYMTSTGISGTASTLNLKFPDGTWSGARNVRLNNTNVTNHYPANTVIKLTYDGTYWKCDNYDSNTNYYDREAYKASVTASAAIAAGRIGVFGTDGKLKLLAASAFDTAMPILYVGTAYTASALTQTNNYTFWGTAFALTNTHAIAGAAAGKPVYVVGTMDGNVMTPNGSVLTCTVPTKEDGLYYMRLGLMSTAANAVLESQHPIYAFTGGRFQQATPSVVTTANTVNEVRQTVDGNSAKISSLETATDGLSSRLATAETSITQNREQIALRATRAEVNADRRGQNLYVAANEVAGYLSAALAMAAPSATNLEVTSDFIPLLGASTFSVQTWLEQPKAMWLCYAFYAEPTPKGYVTPASRPAKNATGTYLAYEGVAVPSGASYVRVSYRSYGIGRCKVEVDGLTAWSDAPADSDLYGTRAELRVHADSIESKVSRGEVISSINQSAETVRIQAGRIELDGTAVFDSISSRVGGTVTDAQAVYWQAEGALAPDVSGLAWVEYAGECVTYEGGGEDDEGEAARRWSTKPPTYSAAFPVTWVATQRRLLGGAVETSAPAMDDRMTVIDGGRIVANSVTAESIDAESLLAEGAAVTVAIGTAIDAATGELATKGDVADVRGDLADATAALEGAIGSVGESADQVAGSVSELRGWVDIGSTADGDPALVMGKKDAGGAYDAATPLMRLTNRGLDIGVGDEALVQMLVEELADGSRESVPRIMRAVIMGELRFGDYAFVARSNGNMALKYVGDDD